MHSTASVIIPIQNAADTLGDQLEALSSQVDAPAFEVLAVLNRCTDSSKAIAASYCASLPLTLLEADELPSAAYARNFGAARSSAPLLLFCDADDRVGEQWVSEMRRALETTPADFVGGRILVDRNNLPDWLYRWRYERLDGSCTWTSPLGPRYAISASLACKRSAFEAVGGFDPQFLGAGGEEVDFANRLLRSGYRIGEAPGAQLLYRPRTTPRDSEYQLRSYRHGELVLRAKEGHLPPRPSTLDVLRGVSRLGIRLLLREREWHPRAIYYRLLDRYRRLRAEQQFDHAADAPKQIAARNAADFVPPLDTALIGGLAFQARRLQARWYAKSGIERWSLALLEKMLPDAGVFVDCGANVGTFTVAAALRVGNDGRVLAFEPDPRTRHLLAANVQRHGLDRIVDIRSEAVGAERSQEVFKMYDNDPVSGFLHAPDSFRPGDVATEVLVDIVPLNDVIDAPVDVVKVDVEGYELMVLAGLSDLLWTDSDTAVLIELNPEALRTTGHDISHILSFFAAEHWALWLINDQSPTPSNAIRKFDDKCIAFLETVEPGWYGNLLAVPLRRRDKIDAIIRRIGVVDRCQPSEKAPR